MSVPPPVHPYHYPASLRRRSYDQPERGTTVHKRASTSHIKLGSSPDKKGKGNPLRRGDACLMCRAKKLKCSATKPACDQCSKRNDRCVYDPIRPASRVEKLELKLGELEQAELHAAAVARRHSAESYASSSSLPNALGFTPSSVPTHSYSTSGGHTFNHPFAIGYAPVRQDAMWSPASSSPVLSRTEPLAPIPVFQQQQSWTLPTLTPLPSYWSTSAPLTHTPSLPSAHSTTTSTPVGYSVDPSITLVGQPTFPSLAPTPICSHPTLKPLDTEIASQTFDEILNHATSLQAFPQLQEKDISQSARDYLVNLFFSPSKIIFASEPGAEERFKSRYALPMDRRPDPCLLFSMYVIASAGSYIPAVRALATSLYTICLTKIAETVAREEHLLDAVEAMTNLSKWLQVKGRAIEAYEMVARAVSLALLGGLHTSSLGEGKLGAIHDERDRYDRIRVFWDLWKLEKDLLQGSGLPPLIRDEDISAPLPRPYSVDGMVSAIVEVEMKSQSPADLGRAGLREIYAGSLSANSPLNHLLTLHIASVHLRHRAQQLLDSADEGEAAFDAKPTTSNTSSHIRHPQAYSDIVQALEDIEARMNSNFQVGDIAPFWSDHKVPATLINICVTRIALHHTEDGAETSDFDVCLKAARGATGLIKKWHPADSPSSEDDQQLKPSAWVLSPWIWVLDRLARYDHILEQQGRPDANLYEEIERVKAILKHFGLIYTPPIFENEDDIKMELGE